METNSEMLLNAIANRIANGEFHRVTDVCKQTLMLSREEDNRPVEAASLIGLAASHRYQGKFYEARVFSDGAMELASQDMPQLLVEAICEEAAIQIDASSRNYEAVVDFKNALEVATEIGYKTGMAKALYGLSWAFTSIGWYGRASRYAREALEQARELDDHILQCQALLMLGSAQQGLGNDEKAKEAFRHALRMTNLHAYYSLEGLAKLGLANIHARSTRHREDAESYYDQALTIAQETGWLRLEFAVLDSLGMLAQNIEDYATAYDYFEDMLDMASEIDNPIYEAGANMNLGKLAITEKDFDVALERFLIVENISRSHNHPAIEASAKLWIAMIHNTFYEYDDALEYLRGARDIYTSLEDEPAASRVLREIVLTSVLLIVDKVLRLVGVHRKSEYDN
jgi:tetratricopeptide (TPR) repeat protein